jgi:phage terminase large subunit
MLTTKVTFNPVFRPVNESRERYRVLKGSAGSGKSTDIAQDYIVKLMDSRYKGANLLVIRKAEASNQNSTFPELIGAVNRICGNLASRIWRVTLNPMALSCVATGSSVIFRGMNDIRQREKVKSVTFAKGKLTWIWIEEATEMEEGDVEILDDRLRGILDNPNLYYQMTFTFNPVSSSHWIKRKYFDAESPDVLTHHSTYRDNRFIDPAYLRRMERRKAQDPEGYKVYGLGEWGETGGLILANYKVEEFDCDPSRFDSRVYGQDFGFNHANAILDVRFRDGEIYICDEIYVCEKDTTEIIPMADAKKFDKRARMWCDSAEPDRIKMWASAGYKAIAVSKPPGSVHGQIDYLKGRKIHIHPRCQWTIKEIQAWKYKKNPTTGLYEDEPVEFFDDAMAALRYSIENLRNQRRPMKIDDSILGPDKGRRYRCGRS